MDALWGCSVGLLLIVASLAMIRWHSLLRSPEALAALPVEERRFAQGRLRRRMQMSGLIAGCGLLLMVGQFVSEDANPRGFLAIWATIMLLVAWAALLAMADLFTIHRQGVRLQHRLKAERHQLERSIAPQSLQPAEPPAYRGNGHGDVAHLGLSSSAGPGDAPGPDHAQRDENACDEPPSPTPP